MESLLPLHGGYRQLKSFQLAQLVYDLTVRFVALYVNRKSRTRDQMEQAARSGVQNIAEASVASGTSKKTELKLTNVARASLEELKLDYEDYLRQRNAPLWPSDHPALLEFKRRRIGSLDELRGWLAWGRETRTHTDGHGQTRTEVLVRVRPCPSVSRICPWQSVWVANAALTLLNLTGYLLKRQLTRLETDFLRDGGFTERMYRKRREVRDASPITGREG